MYPRQTTSSATRASLADEKKRKEKEPAEHLKTTSAKSKNHKINVSNRENTATHNQIPVSKLKQYHDNLDFYRNTIRSKPPPGNTIEEMLLWKGDYNRLERNHHYIQWLFPITEGNGMNIHAQPLFDHEAKKIRNEAKMRHRVIKAYKMMLDFYGMQLIDEELGIVGRSRKGWEERYEHLNRSRHNLRRITRILKSLGELGLEKYQAPLVNFLIEEAVAAKALPNLNGPCLLHWIDAVNDESEREKLYMESCGMEIKKTDTMEDVDSESEEELEQQEKQEGSVLKNDSGISLACPKCSESVSRTTDRTFNTNMKSDNIGDGTEIHVISDNAQAGEMKKTTDVFTSEQAMRKECELPCDNLKFYQNNLVSRPFPGYTIETILNSKGQYEFLENCPCFIQWLFPVPDNTDWNGGFQSLCEHESKAIRQDDKLSSRVLEAYELILDFYGMRLSDTVSGKIARNKHAYKKRYDIFNRYRYNLRIITQVLKSLGELGFERFQVPWIDFLIQEGIDNAMFPSLDGNCILHWIDAISDEEEKQAMFRKYQRLASHSAVSVTGEELDLAGMKLF